MCGRVAHSARAVSAAAAALSNRNSDRGVTGESNSVSEISARDEKEGTASAVEESPTTKDASAIGRPSTIPPISSEPNDRLNSGPGHRHQIFRRSTEGTNGMECTPNAVWGLLPNDGTQQSPHRLPDDGKYSVSPHYTMFNARSETLHDKKSFGNLIRNGQTCILAVEGYYEWVQSPQSLDKKKQPYFIRLANREQQQPLLLAGLWSCVKTGRRIKDGNSTGNNMKDETITTFTILTADAHHNYTWLHPRQPVMLWDVSIALEWLMRPNRKLVDMLCRVPIKGSSNIQSIWETSLSVFPVSRKINDGKYQGDDCMQEVKLEKVPSIKSFFVTKKAKTGKKTIKGSKLPRYAALEISSTTKICPPSEQKQPTTAQELQSVSKVASHDTHTESKGKTWACSQCTYVHTGPGKFEYLACELCGSERTDGRCSTDSPKEKKRKAMV